MLTSINSGYSQNNKAHNQKDITMVPMSEEQIPINMKCIPYEYQHVPVPGGGFVTGFCFHPRKKDILYARTDIGGVYRYDFSTKGWLSLMDHVKTTGKWESYPLSIALDDNNPDWLYIASGDWDNNFLCRSKDRGKHFEYFQIPAGVHGNASGRGTGERLVVDSGNPSILYYGSQTEGLLVSEDYGESWRVLQVCPLGGRTESDLAFVWLDSKSVRNGRCQTIIASTSGKENSRGGTIRGCSLYISKDAGNSFTPMPGQPIDLDYGNYPGFIGQRVAFTGNYLYITLAAVKYSWAGWHGYACDMGGAQRGCILRYELTPQGDVVDFTYVTPNLSDISGNKEIDSNINNGRESSLGESNISINDITGFGGIDADANYPGHLICSTQCCGKDETIFYSTDYGDHWTSILQGLTTGTMDFETVPYMKPKNNNNVNLIHWLSDLKMDPFDSNRAVFNTGTGIFMTENLLDILEGKSVIWKPSCHGLEETVHLNVYSPPSGEVQLIDIIGDLGGFAFTDLTCPADNTFSDENSNRYITCLNADFPDCNPELVAVTARGNWTGKTTGGVIWSEDQCRTWRHLPDPTGITKYIDKLIENIHRPNNNSGWVAVSADAKTLVWCVGEEQLLPIDSVVYTDDLGNSWNRCIVYDKNNQVIKKKRIEDSIQLDENKQQDENKQLDENKQQQAENKQLTENKQLAENKQPDESNQLIENTTNTLKVLSDRVDPELFYGFGNDSTIFISTDRARTFHQMNVHEAFPKFELGGIDTIMPAEIRGETGKTGIVWIATGEGGLWIIKFHKESKSAEFVRITKDGDSVYRQGMGKAAPQSIHKALYINGILQGEYGFYRSLDEGETWQRINNEKQMFGDIRSIVGDPRTFGRFYIATGSRGVLWGEPLPLEKEEEAL